MDVLKEACSLKCRRFNYACTKNSKNSQDVRIDALKMLELYLKTVAVTLSRMYRSCPSPIFTVFVCILCWTHISTAFTLDRDFYYGVYSKRGKTKDGFKFILS